MTAAGFEPAPISPTVPALPSPNPTGRPRTRPQSTSLDTRQQPHIGRTNHRPKRPARPRVAPKPGSLEHLLADPRERQELKRDLSAVLEEIARRADAEQSWDEFTWFDAKSAAILDCTNVRVLIDPACGGGTATPISCRVRGCPDCERARMGRLLSRFEEIVTGYRAHDGKSVPPMARPVFWTWAPRNTPAGHLADGLARLRKDFGRLRRRSILKGGPCRWRWRQRGPTGELDGAAGHPCHQPVPAAECRPKRCAEGCGARYGNLHAEGCDPGCPTRTGARQSHCRTHPPHSVHPDGCPSSCAHAGHDKRRNCPDFRHEPVQGGVSAIEVTWSEADGGSWHPHVHALVDAGSWDPETGEARTVWIPWAEMRDAWQSITCDRAKCRHGSDPACRGAWTTWVEAVDRDDPERRRGAIREVLKYVSKPAGIIDSLNPERIREFLWSTRGLRAVNGWGSLYHVKDPEEEAPTGTVVIRFGFSVMHAPAACPCCGRRMTADDWDWPKVRSRLEAARGPGGWVWRPRGAPPPVQLEVVASPATVPAKEEGIGKLWT